MPCGEREYADHVAGFFLDQCLVHSTTTAMVFGTVEPEFVDAFFSAAQQRNLRMITGKVMMDRNAPDYRTAVKPRTFSAGM